MILELREFLNPAEVARLTELSQQMRFVEGRVSNAANVTKDNLQADHGDARYAESVRIVADAFTRSAPFREFAFPKQIAPPLLCRYEPGMKYGAHADAAHIALANGIIRSDLSCTVFLSDPMSYDGGELVIHAGTKPIVMKGVPGEAIVYPSTYLHEVRPVRSGRRLVSITFIESMIKDEHKRTQLYELHEISALEGERIGWQSRVRLEVVLQNLLRMWSEH
ncbi:MAG: Fe2+-dependent dioxygenase [Alphaproteobacteria bacterium]|nr:Fe2+-dependent dioxygenase [Alphaproteobacteria bacterium]MBV9420522.1 Fe2+-dependent dioxygenase [Alphaproteobacteria bacterium]MBV9541959.1 Fe2+-dependent dioxygenase [Alphaproteobacteria bacterium]